MNSATQTLAAVRQPVREMLASSPAFQQLNRNEQRELYRNMLALGAQLTQQALNTPSARALADRDLHAKQIEQLTREPLAPALGIGRYPRHLHVDLRNAPARWTFPDAATSSSSPRATELRTALGSPPLFAGGVWHFPEKDGVVLIWYGANFAGGKEGDHSMLMVAETLAETLADLQRAGQLGRVTIRVFRGDDKQALFDELAVAAAGSVIQLHYVGHGNPGGLYAAYQSPRAAEERQRDATALLRFAASGTTSDELRRIAVVKEPSLMTGILDLARYRDPARRALHERAFVQLWGCFAGAESHRFEAGYWSNFATGSDTPSVSVHLAQHLKVPVIASADKEEIHGNEFWYRDKAGRVGQSDEARRRFRPDGIPQWLWPAKGASWVTRGPDGKAVYREQGDTVASALTDHVTGPTKAGRRAANQVASLSIPVASRNPRPACTSQTR